MLIQNTIFKCKTDEEVFYSRLSEVLGIQKILFLNKGLQITVNPEHEARARTELRTICEMWNATIVDIGETSLSGEVKI